MSETEQHSKAQIGTDNIPQTIGCALCSSCVPLVNTYQTLKSLTEGRCSVYQESQDSGRCGKHFLVISQVSDVEAYPNRESSLVEYQTHEVRTSERYAFTGGMAGRVGFGYGPGQRWPLETGALRCSLSRSTAAQSAFL